MGLTEVPEWVWDCTEVEWLNLANRLSHLAEWLLELDKLDLRWNPLDAVQPRLDELEARGCAVLL